MTEMKVSAINYYPIKSCGGLPLESAVLDCRGIVHDREFMVVGKNVEGQYELVRQSKQPRMALIRPKVNKHILQASAPGIENLEIQIIREGNKVDAVVHGNVCSAVDQGEEAAKWLRKYLGEDYRLVRMTDEFVRKINPRYAQREYDQVGFQDGYPLLLISEESLNDLNSRLHQPVRMNRFRPNIVIKGNGNPFVEDDVRLIKIGENYFDAVKPCDRCPIPGIEQETGEISKEVLKVLNNPKYRRGADGKVYFGQNLIHQSPGMVHVGDKVEILMYKNENEKIKWLPEKAAV